MSPFEICINNYKFVEKATTLQKKIQICRTNYNFVTLVAGLGWVVGGAWVRAAASAARSGQEFPKPRLIESCFRSYFDSSRCIGA